MRRIEQLLAELTSLPSVNPAFLPEGHPHGGEKQVAQFLAATAACAGLDVELQEVLPGRPNVMVHLRPSGKRRETVLFAPHLDTVGAAGTGFIPRRKNGRLYARGSCDTKGSAAVMLYALLQLAASPGRPRHTEIVFAGLIDEEHAQAGSRALVRRGFKAQLAVVGEPTGCQVVTAHKGNLWLGLETRGKAAHAATPRLGKNAVLEMARVVQVLETDYARLLNRRSHPLLGSGTVNVGKISGGIQPNIVPARCSIELDRRTLPGETEHGVRREIAALLAAKNLRARMCNSRLAPASPLETDPDLPLVRQFMLSNRQSRPVGVDYFCDAAVLSEGGIPSIVFGPGHIAQAHTEDEWVALSQLDQASALLVRFCKSLS